MEVEEAIYNSMPLRTHAVIMIKGIMDSLDEEDRTALQKQYATLAHLRNNSASDTDIEKLYAEVASYLHKRYLQEVLGAHPRVKGTGHLA